MAGKKYIDLKENDYVEFYIYPNLSNGLPSLNEVKENVCRIVNQKSKNYLWHNEEFFLSPIHNNSSEFEEFNSSEAFAFRGVLHYGENIEDEWFLVYLLLELSLEIKDLVIRTKDVDGEFLLIEAAESLPSWITPETCEDRVFIYKGSLHILPKNYQPNPEDYVVSDEVIHFIRENSESSIADDKIQEAIKKRIAMYPQGIDKNFHKTNLFVPVAVAALLDVNPSMIAPAVRAFCERDLLDVKTCQAMKFFPPENRVFSHIKFTKCLYAMLATSKYVPDQKTGWNLPLPNDESYKSHLLGVKVACGFEILVSQYRSKEIQDDESEEIDFNSNPHWIKFLNNLSSNGYFRGLLQHSKEYNTLFEAAKDFFRKSFRVSYKPNRAKELSELLDTLDIDTDELKRREKNLPEPDDEDWMNISQADLDAMLESRFGRTDDYSKNDNPDISGRLKTFINHMSEFDGADFPKLGKDSVPAKLKKKTKTKKSKTVKFSPDTKLENSKSEEKLSKENAKIQFEPEGFINAIQNILDFSIPDDNYWESDGSSMSSYEDETNMELLETKATSSKKDKNLVNYMHEMDLELAESTISKSFVTKSSDGNESRKFAKTIGNIGNYNQIDIEGNALKNILSSYHAQNGNPGPAENLLGPLGVHFQKINKQKK